MILTPILAESDYCYLTATGRRTGRPHTVEIWFGIDGDTLYVLAGGRKRADFVRNARETPDVGVRIGDSRFESRARIVTDNVEDAKARRLLLEKYRARYSGDLDEWGRDALAVAFDITSVAAS